MFEVILRNGAEPGTRTIEYAFIFIRVEEEILPRSKQVVVVGFSFCEPDYRFVVMPSDKNFRATALMAFLTFSEDDFSVTGREWLSE